jgi:MFS family permease
LCIGCDNNCRGTPGEFLSLSSSFISPSEILTIEVSDCPQTISKALNGTAIQALWMGTAFLLASTVWQPNFVAFSDVFGRRPLLLFALTLFTIGAIMCGISKNVTVMLVGRCVQGSGVGGIMTLTEAIITDLIPLRERGNYFALISIVWAIGTVSGKFAHLLNFSQN